MPEPVARGKKRRVSQASRAVSAGVQIRASHGVTPVMPWKNLNEISASSVKHTTIAPASTA